MKITTGIKNAKIEYGKETFTYPLNTISYAVDDSFTGLTLFRNNERIGTAPLDQVTVDGQSLTPDGVHSLLLPLFAARQGGGIGLPIEISDVNGLEVALSDSLKKKKGDGTLFLSNDDTYKAVTAGIPQGGITNDEIAIDAAIDESKISGAPFVRNSIESQGDIVTINSSHTELSSGTEDSFRSSIAVYDYNVYAETYIPDSGSSAFHLNPGSFLVGTSSDTGDEYLSANMHIGSGEVNIEAKALKLNDRSVVTFDENGNLLIPKEKEIISVATDDSQHSLVKLSTYERGVRLSEVKIGDVLSGEPINFPTTITPTSTVTGEGYIRDEAAGTYMYFQSDGTYTYISYYNGQSGQTIYDNYTGWYNGVSPLTFDTFVVSSINIPEGLLANVLQNTTFGNGTFDQVEAGSETLHLNLNSEDRVTVESSSGKEEVAYMSDILNKANKVTGDINYLNEGTDLYGSIIKFPTGLTPEGFTDGVYKIIGTEGTLEFTKSGEEYNIQIPYRASIYNNTEGWIRETITGDYIGIIQSVEHIYTMPNIIDNLRATVDRDLSHAYDAIARKQNRLVSEDGLLEFNDPSNGTTNVVSTIWYSGLGTRNYVLGSYKATEQYFQTYGTGFDLQYTNGFPVITRLEQANGSAVYAMLDDVLPNDSRFSYTLKATLNVSVPIRVFVVLIDTNRLGQSSFSTGVGTIDISAANTDFEVSVNLNIRKLTGYNFNAIGFVTNANPVTSYPLNSVIRVKGFQLFKGQVKGDDIPAIGELLRNGDVDQGMIDVCSGTIEEDQDTIHSRIDRGNLMVSTETSDSTYSSALHLSPYTFSVGMFDTTSDTQKSNAEFYMADGEVNIIASINDVPQRPRFNNEFAITTPDTTAYSMSVLTQGEYDALAEKDPNTLYFVKQ